MTRSSPALVSIRTRGKDRYVAVLDPFKRNTPLILGLYRTIASGKRLGYVWHGRNLCVRRYWKEAYFKALASIEAVSEKNGLTLAEVALRWMTHHSYLKREYGDTVIIGASSVAHIKQVRAACLEGYLT